MPAALREARTVQSRLSAATREDVSAWSVLVVLGCEVVTKTPVSDLSVVPALDIVPWLRQLPGGRLTPVRC